jgi:hypothetical protein
MKLKKLEILDQASKDTASVSLSCERYEAYILSGIKIVRDNIDGKIEIYNTAVNGDYYKILDKIELKNFTKKSWRYGVYVISLSNYRLKLNKIERKIKEEINGRASIRYIKALKTQREGILLKFSKTNQKLNQLNQII